MYTRRTPLVFHALTCLALLASSAVVRSAAAADAGTRAATDGDLAWGEHPQLPDSADFLEAVRSGDVATVGSLLDERPELIDCGDDEGRSVFLLAHLHGQREVARFLLRRGYLLDLVDAALVPDWDRVRILVDESPERVNEYHPVGGTVLYAAARMGQGQLWRLLNHGADPDANPRGAQGVTAAFGALECEDPLDAYLAAVALYGSGGDANAPQRDGWSALHAAVARNHAQLTRFLVRRGARVDARDAQGRTPLDVARERDLDAMVTLLEQHESIPRNTESSRFAYDAKGEPLEMPDLSHLSKVRRNGFCRAAGDHLSMVVQAFEEDPRLVLALSTRDELAVEAAARAGRHDIVHFLLGEGAPQSLTTSIAIGDLDRARELLAEDPQRAHERSSLDYPPMWFCAIGGAGVEAARLLLEYGAPVDQESLGTTGLHWAAREGDIELARFLLENGADLDAVGYAFSRTGKTPVDVARGRRRGQAMVEFLEQWDGSER